MESNNNDDEPLPIHDELHVIEYHSIRKNSMWWSAVVLFKDKYRKRNRIGLYLWHKEKSKWKRKHKFVINSDEKFKKIVNVVKFWLPQL